MTLQETAKLAAHMQRLLKVRNIAFPIAKTEKGNVSLKYVKDIDGYQILLDAVPLDMKEYDNRELKSMMEKYFFDQEAETPIEKEVDAAALNLPVPEVEE